MQNAPREHSAILLTLMKPTIVFKTFVLSIFEWPLKTGFTVFILYTIFTGSIFDVEDREAKTGFLFGITRYNSIPKKTFELRGFVEEIDIVDSFQLASASRFLFYISGQTRL